MANFESTFKDEVRRLARKEIRLTMGNTQQTVTALRREVNRLKHKVDSLEKKLAKQSRLVARGAAGEAVAAVTAPDEETSPKRFSRRGLHAHRKKLGLSAADYGRLAGLSGLSIYNYEHGKTRPRNANLAALMAIRQLGKREAEQRLAEMDGN